VREGREGKVGWRMEDGGWRLEVEKHSTTAAQHRSTYPHPASQRPATSDQHRRGVQYEVPYCTVLYRTQLVVRIRYARTE